MKIAVVGAQGTGKTSLVHALRLAMPVSDDPTVCTVDEGFALAQAVQQDLLLQNGTLYAPAALQHQRSYDLTLLTGLDLPSHIREGEREGSSPPRAHWDARLRKALDSQAIPYAVVYGTGQARTDCALQAIACHRAQPSTRSRPAPIAWQWCCETCSDADCEHRLFSALVKKSDSVQP